MTDNELLLAISNIVNTNTKTIEQRIDRVEASLNNKIDEVEASLNNKIDEVEASLNNKIDEVEASLNNKIDEVDRRLSTSVNNILLRMENIIEPRLDHIEACYVSTSKRYQDEVDKVERLELNMEVVQSVVKEHAEKLHVMTA